MGPGIIAAAMLPGVARDIADTLAASRGIKPRSRVTVSFSTEALEDQDVARFEAHVDGAPPDERTAKAFALILEDFGPVRLPRTEKATGCLPEVAHDLAVSLREMRRAAARPVRVNGLVTDPPRPGEAKLKVLTDGTVEGTRVLVLDPERDEHLELANVLAVRLTIDGARVVVELLADGVDVDGPEAFDVDVERV